MVSPDVRPYVDLTLLDLTPQTIYDNAVATLQLNLPGWVPREGNTEVLLLEAMALQVAEAVYAINRLPAATAEILAQLYGITRDAGAPPTTTLTFAMVGTAGYTIPAGTQAKLVLDASTTIVFTTDVDLVISPGGSSGTVAATGDEYTDAANGIDGTVLTLIDALLYVNSCTIASAVANGADPEDDDAYFARAALRYSRLHDSLVLASHFEATAMEDTTFPRAKAIDNWTPETIATPVLTDVTNASVGGTLGDGTYSYRISAINADGETLASTADSVEVATATGTNLVTLTWTAPDVPSGVGAITGYKIYGRSAGTELLMATVGLVLTWDDDGSLTPAGALPTANTTGPAVDAAPGHITLAVYGPSRYNTTLEKSTLETDLAAMAAAQLAVHVTDPTITAVDVTVSVTIKSGYVSTDVVAAVEAALNDYLSADTWEWGDTVYRNELISLVDQVTGVDRVVALTEPASDLVLTGAANLTTPDVIAVTVV